MTDHTGSKGPAADSNLRVGVGILGVSGYTGAELLRLLLHHPHADILALGSRQYAGQLACDVFAGLPQARLPIDDGSDPQAWKARGVDVVFAALPHGAFASRARAFMEAGLRIVDVSSDFRLRDPADYPRHYATEHPDAPLLAQAVYGLCEWLGDEGKQAIQQAQLVANPGCYPTASLLAILPAVAAGWVSSKAPLVIHAMSGVSGAGRTPKTGTLLAECGNSISPYKVGDQHPHLGEMGQTIAAVTTANATPILLFNPHLMPMTRGILASITMPLRQAISQEQAQACYGERYANCSFVRVLQGSTLPETRHVRGSNRCDMAVRVVNDGRTLLVFSAIDNLIKGAAGQAIQNWNLMQGWHEATGLPVDGMSWA